MAIRNIRIMGDEVLGKICKPVKKMTPRTRQLIDDMFDTMYDGCGVGLAANQVGILKRIVSSTLQGKIPMCSSIRKSSRPPVPRRAGGLFKPPGKSRYCDPSGSCEGESPG